MKRKEGENKDVGKVAEDANQVPRGAGPEELNPGADLLSDLHATSCALKAYASTLAGEGLETCRRACGGHGYSSFSGIGSWYADYLPTLTWEGDNYMLTQQVSRYLLKSARAVLDSAKKSGNFNAVSGDNDTTRILKTYRRRQDVGAAFDVLDSDEELVDAFAWRTAHLTFEALRHRDEEKRSWNSLLVDFWRLSTAHAQYMVVKNFHGALASSSLQSALPTQTKEVLHDLFKLFALHTLERESSEFFQSAACTIRQIQLARTKTVPALLEKVRPHAVRLVDAWKFPDWQLDSSLGRFDGNVYEDMFKRASEDNPLNKVVFDPYPDSDVLFKKDERKNLRSKL
jgi:acyl-CoA oxidase